MNNQFLRAIGGDKKWFDRFFMKQHTNLIRKGFAGEWPDFKDGSGQKLVANQGTRVVKSEYFESSMHKIIC
jgi:hypothetical protein